MNDFIMEKKLTEPLIANNNESQDIVGNNENAIDEP
jgi:hypothetical protein